ncbi:Bystin-domain-containing protein [Xylariaceae sp. FL0255]|nr:Bystin-domain-containing protein [Xylariaceae sp. FL0255]
MPKATTPKLARRTLEDEYLANAPLRNRAPKRKSKDGEEREEAAYVDSKASQKILQIGRELAAEDEENAPQPPPLEPSAFGFDSRYHPDEDAGDYDDAEVWADDDDDEIIEEIVEPDDLDTFNRFLPTDEDPLITHGPWHDVAEEEQGTSTNLADLILARIAEHEAGQDRADAVGPVDEDYELSPKVVEVYTKIGVFLSRYKSGKLPKPFKILPTVPHWEDIIQLTKPDQWTPNAVLAATRIFISSTPAVARRFLEMVLLDRVREDISETKKLNVHLFDALKKALYKPAAFFKAILFPLVESGATLREAHIISAVLVRVSIPVLHSGAALKGLCDIAAREAAAMGTERSGATNIFIKALLDKKYALPYQVVDALVFHFLRFRSNPAENDTAMGGLMHSERAAAQAKLPVIWHQCLLSFATRYKNEITEDQREMLLDLLLTCGHHQIGPLIRRELLAGRGRGTLVEPQGPALDGDDTMIVDG